MIIDDVLRSVPAVRHAVLLSPDGLVQAHSPGMTTTGAEYLASMAAMLHSLAHRAGALLDGGEPQHVAIRFSDSSLVLVAAGPAAHLAVTTTRDPAEVLRHLPRRDS
ncbi:roadblock/LC7 domain-containing protein [Amycolatopsis thermophila]|uniref:Regulator of Ras-like GTPase activity (Roadblock/LC7/MglB family) n=1 Tax=Amycolatopsis thermophila TaxID=206084 RepID=A0ABU0ELV6_9PSEU|nr:roadblock/LC7 domain-containing protein [Amycolatopsis thermophila]MDQ0376257.1 putative regulator of Ras-like GTPase activity (Roadblock/LC7/MglB family) [Amycolatopsis thermophila]